MGGCCANVLHFRNFLAPLCSPLEAYVRVLSPLKVLPAALGAVLLVAGCSTSHAPAPTSQPTSSASMASSGTDLTGSPIKIGVLDDLTGTGAIEGSLLHIGVDMVVDQINSTGGINGHPVQTEFVDPRADATQSIQLATQLVQQDNVDLLVGGGFSPECLAVQDLAQKLQVVYVPADACAT